MSHDYREIWTTIKNWLPRAFSDITEPAHSPARPPIAYDPVGGCAGEWAGAESAKIEIALVEHDVQQHFRLGCVPW